MAVDKLVGKVCRGKCEIIKSKMLPCVCVKGGELMHCVKLLKFRKSEN